MIRQPDHDEWEAAIFLLADNLLKIATKNDKDAGLKLTQWRVRQDPTEAKKTDLFLTGFFDPKTLGIASEITGKSKEELLLIQSFLERFSVYEEVKKASKVRKFYAAKNDQEDEALREEKYAMAYSLLKVFSDDEIIPIWDMYHSCWDFYLQNKTDARLVDYVNLLKSMFGCYPASKLSHAKAA